MTKTPEPSQQLVIDVRVGFIQQGTSFTRWCKDNGQRVSNARQALNGSWDGPKGRALRRRIVQAAGIADQKATA